MDSISSLRKSAIISSREVHFSLALLVSNLNWMRIAEMQEDEEEGRERHAERERETKSIMFLKGHQNKHRHRRRILFLSFLLPLSNIGAPLQMPN